MNLSGRQTATRRPVQRVSAMQAVLDDLRDAIEHGEFEVGDKLPAESILASEFAVSRPVVREALRALQALGMTASRTGKGTYVVAARPVESPTFGRYSARDLLEVRRCVEVPVAGHAAKRRGHEDLAALRELVDRMDTEEDNAEWVALDARFHITVARASGNPVFARVIEELRDALAHQSEFLNQLGDRQRHSNAEHRAILHAIENGEHEEAAAAMTAHLDHVEHTLAAIVRSPRTPESSPRTPGNSPRTPVRSR